MIRKTDEQRRRAAIDYAIKQARLRDGRTLEALIWKNPADAIDAFIKAGTSTIGGIAVVLEAGRYDQSKTQRVLVDGRVSRGLNLSGPASVLVVGFSDGHHEAIYLHRILRSPKFGDKYSVLIQ